MKKLLALILAITLMFAFSACGSNVDENASTTATTTAAEEITVENVTEVENTTEVTTTTVEEETTRAAEYDLYKTISLEVDTLPIQFSDPVKAASFYYVPYNSRTDSDFYFYSILRVEVFATSEELEIYFKGSDTVFPGNMPEAVVYSNSQHTKAEYNIDLGENTATMKGFESGLQTVDILFPMYMSAIDMPIDGEPYEVTCLQVVFVGK